MKAIFIIPKNGICGINSCKINWVLAGANVHNISFENNSSELHD